MGVWFVLVFGSTPINPEGVSLWRIPYCFFAEKWQEVFIGEGLTMLKSIVDENWSTTSHSDRVTEFHAIFN